MTKRKSEVVSVTMSLAMKGLLDAMAAKNGCTRSQYVRKLLAHDLERVGLIALEDCDKDAVKADENEYDVAGEALASIAEQEQADAED